MTAADRFPKTCINNSFAEEGLDVLVVVVWCLEVEEERCCEGSFSTVIGHERAKIWREREKY